MIKKHNILFYFLASMLLITATLQAAFWELKPGAKAGGMAYSYSAAVDNAAAVFYNPANLTLLEKPEISLNYSRLFWGTDEDQLSLKSLFYGSPEKAFGSFGAGIISFSADFYTETSYLASYAKSFRSFGSGFAFGFTFKYLRRNYLTSFDTDISDDPFFSIYGSAISNYTFDAAVTYRHNNGLDQALIFKNTNSPDMAYQNHVSDRVPLMISYALAKRFDLYLPFRFTGEIEIMDITPGKNSNRFWYAAGLEAQLDNYKLVTRAGINKNELTAGLSYNELQYQTFNFSFDMG